MGAFLAAFETLAFHDLSLLIKFGVQFGLFGGSIHNLGTEKHHARYLDDAGHCRLLGCFAMTETGHGSNVAGLRTEAIYDPASDEFVINTPDRGAWKDYIGNAACDARLATVFSQLVVGGESHGVHALLVPIRDEAGNLLPGVHCEDNGLKEGLNGVDNGRLAFDAVRVPRENLLDRFASVSAEGKYESAIESKNRRFFTMLGTLVGGRVSIAASALSASKSALTIAIRYANRRRQFGPEEGPEILLLDYPSHRRRLLPRLARTYAMHFALAHLGQEFVKADTPERQREAELLAAALKPGVTWHGLDVIRAGREACGGQGYLAENRFADLHGDLDVFATFEGDNTVLYQLVAKERLKAFARAMGEGGAGAMAELISQRVQTWLSDQNPIARTNVSRFLDRDEQCKAFDFREEVMLSSCAQVFRKLKSELGAEEAVLRLQPRLLHYARAYMERVVHRQFSVAVEQAEATGQQDLATALGELLDLHFLSRLSEDRAWFLENHYLSPGASEGLEPEIDRLCRRLRPKALRLVDGFGIPDELLMAPIGLKEVPEDH